MATAIKGKHKVTKVGKTTSVRKKAKPKMSLVCAAGEQCFWSRDGQILASLGDLHRALSEMSQDTFLHHVTEDRNDFADWVEFVLSDKGCADALRMVRDQQAACAIVVRRLADYA